MRLPTLPLSRAIAIHAAASALLLAGRPADAQQTPTSTVQLSGVLHTHFRYGGDPEERSQSRFDVERAYVNVRAALAQNLGVRVTADIYQQSDTTRAGYYRGWTLRAKYAYLQYDALRGDDSPLGLLGYARLGIINTVIVEQVDEYWPRWISKSPVDRYGFMASADAGAGVNLATKGGAAELYATVTNGEGYQRAEVDRFKDFSARLTLAPFAGSSGWQSALVLVPWGSVGAHASRYVDGAGTVEPIVRALGRDLWGLFAAYRDRAITLGAEVAARIDETESADTTVDVRPTFADRTNRIASGFVYARPLALLDTAGMSPLGLLFRYDHLTSTSTPEGHGTTIIAGATWDLSSRVSVALDYQGETRHDGFPGNDTRTWFLHAVARF